jgi:hypothetical protein
MKKTLKGFYLLLSTIFITLLNLPFAFAKSNSSIRLSPKPAVAATLPADSIREITAPLKSVYDSLHLDLSGLSRQAFVYAQKGWKKLIKQGKVVNESVMAIIDFSQSSDKKRLYILDMKNYKVLFNTLVAHGKKSGKEMASSYSNKPSSYKSSPGFYVTGETYIGSNGYSLKLQGMEKGINDKAAARAIVMHGADYVSESYVEEQGYIGRSQGCPAVPEEAAADIIDVIKNGACLFIYPATKNYTSRSPILR